MISNCTPDEITIKRESDTLISLSRVLLSIRVSYEEPSGCWLFVIFFKDDSGSKTLRLIVKHFGNILQGVNSVKKSVKLESIEFHFVTVWTKFGEMLNNSEVFQVAKLKTKVRN